MKSSAAFVLLYISLCCAVNMNIFRWPTFNAHPKISSGPFEELSRLKTKAIRKIGQGIRDLKNKVRDFKSSIFSFGYDDDSSGYPTQQPSHYGESSGYEDDNNGYFHIVGMQQQSHGYETQDNYYSGYGTSARPQTGYRAAHQQSTSFRGSTKLSDGSQSSYSNLDAPRKVADVHSNTGHSTTQKLVKFRLHPESVSVQRDSSVSTSYEVSAPLSAAMAMGHLLQDEIISKGGNNQWRAINQQPVTNQQTLTHAAQRGGKQSSVSLKTTKELQKSDSATSEQRSEKSGKALSQMPDVAVESDRVTSTENQLDIVSAEPLREFSDETAAVKEESGRENKNESRGRSIDSPSPQEDIVRVTQAESLRLQDKISKPLVPGEHNDMMFGALLEALGLHMFVRLIRLANLDAMLTTQGGFTIFAPSDSAFGLLSHTYLAKLENNTDKLREVILFHVIPSRIHLTDVRHEMILASAAPGGRILRLNIYDFGSDLQPIVTVNGARLRKPDMMATNGIIHVIDRVLYPMAELTILEHLKTCDTFKGGQVAFTSSGVTSLLNEDGPFTVFVPSTHAFSLIDNSTVTDFFHNITLLQDIMLFHVVDGTYYSEGVRDGTYLPTLLEGAEIRVRVSSDGYTRRLTGVGQTVRILEADIPAKNGVLHITDRVLQPDMEMIICEHM